MINQSKRGSILGVTVLAIFTISLVSLSILALSMTSHKLAMRNEELAKARSVAESELERVYYDFRFFVLDRGMTNARSAASQVTGVDQQAQFPTTPATPFLEEHRTAGWQVKRSINVLDPYRGVMEGSAMTGTFTTVDMKVEVSPPPNTPFANTVQVRAGRIVTSSTGNIFGPGAFYQGCDIELANSGRVQFTGDVVCGGSIYMGSTASGSLDLSGHVSYLTGHGFNTDPGADGLFGTADDDYTTRKPGTGLTELNRPNFTSNADQVVAQAAQVNAMDTPINLLGGVDLDAVRANNPNLFISAATDNPAVAAAAGNAAALAAIAAAAENDIQRSLIVPPPSAGNSNEYTPRGLTSADDVSLGARRAYNRAADGGLIITVEANGAVSVEKCNSNGTREAFHPAGIENLITSVNTFSDRREGVAVNVTEIDVSVLKDLVGYTVGEASPTAFPDFNGVLYVNLKSGGVGDPSHQPSAVRLVNATVTPHTKIVQDGVPPDGGGFSVATNGALYVKGSYNTLNADGVTTSVGSAINPSILMADTVTVLSDGWDDANSTLGIANRVASSLHTDAGGVPIVALNCAIATGNTRAGAGSPGDGVQNLVRYLEDWTGITASYNGTLCRLFDAKMFTAPFVDPSEGDVYRVPGLRAFSPDPQLQDRPPPGSMSTGNIVRGRFYYW